MASLGVVWRQQAFRVDPFLLLINLLEEEQWMGTRDLSHGEEGGKRDFASYKVGRTLLVLYLLVEKTTNDLSLY